MADDNDPSAPSPTSSRNGAPIPLGYVKEETRANVAILHDGPVVRIIAPPLGAWRHLMTVRCWVAAICLYVCSIFLFNREPGGLIYGAFGGFLLWQQSVQFGRRRVFEVTPTEVRVGYARGTKIIWLDRWPPANIAEVRLNRFTGDLLIRVTGVDMKEYFISRDRHAAQRVADELDAALRAVRPL